MRKINKNVIARAVRLVAPLRLSRGQRLLADFAEAEQRRPMVNLPLLIREIPTVVSLLRNDGIIDKEK